MMHRFPGGVFSLWALCQGQRQFSLSGSSLDYNIVLIIMKKDGAQHYHISVRPKSPC